MPKKKTVRKASKRSEVEYVNSPVIRVGIVVFFILVIGLVAYVVKYFTP